MNSQVEQNKKHAVEFYRMSYSGCPEKAVEQYVGDEYIQHNPVVMDGKQGFIDYFQQMATEYPQKNIEFLRVIGEGNLVALHTHQQWPDGDEYVTMDFFRFDNDGKIVEHWDAIQQIPDRSLNGHSMF
ncbi:nuclear transport factor 2 family protein [Vibrio cionasavignyae]|uniref:nuclear transport factor 2 family protein n=1 Tax=Vibrio cionasavignyae TaxID=2910252 RepID=UPI003D0EBCEC